MQLISLSKQFMVTHHELFSKSFALKNSNHNFPFRQTLPTFLDQLVIIGSLWFGYRFISGPKCWNVGRYRPTKNPRTKAECQPLDLLSGTIIREIHTCHVLQIWKIQLKSLCPASKAPGKPIALFGALHAGSQSWQRLRGPGWIVSYSVHQSIKMNKVLDVSQCSLEASLLYWTFHGVVPLCLLVVLHPKTVPKWLATKEKKSLGATTIHHPYPPFLKDSLDSLRVAFPIVSNWCAVLGFDRPCRICTSRFIFTWHPPATGLVARDPIPQHPCSLCLTNQPWPWITNHKITNTQLASANFTCFWCGLSSAILSDLEEAPCGWWHNGTRSGLCSPTDSQRQQLLPCSWGRAACKHRYS